jgi:hypothetical protein
MSVFLYLGDRLLDAPMGFYFYLFIYLWYWGFKLEASCLLVGHSTT